MDEYSGNNGYADNNQWQQEDEFDYVALLKNLWKGWKTIAICTAIFIVLGLVAALTMRRTYSVSTVMVPQRGESTNSSLSSLASLAGVNLSSVMNRSGEVSPVIYPQIVSSVPFRLELMNTPLHYTEADTTVTMLTYAREYAKPSVMGVVKKYTIGLPGLILQAIRKPQPEVSLPEEGESDGPKPLVVGKDEDKLMRVLAECVTLAVDKKDGYITLSVRGTQPLQTAELALKAQQLLQDEVTRLRTEKTQSDLEYIQARYDEIKAEAESYQTSLAIVTDRSKELATSRSRIERDRLQSKYTIANAIYTQMAQELEAAKMQVKRDTPVFTVIQPVTVPNKPSNSRSKVLMIWTFLGFLLGCGIVLAKAYWPDLKEKFESEE